MKKSRLVAFSGLYTALSVILLSLGSIFWFCSYVMPITTGLLLIVLADLFGKKSASLTYISVSVLSLVLLSDKESALMYAMLFGCYPLFRAVFEKIKLKLLRILLKFLYFNLSVVAIELICVYLFKIPLDDFLGKWGIIVLLLLGNVLFAVYEKLFDVLQILYDNKLKKRITKYLQ